jgi:hypothetical protein
LREIEGAIQAHFERFQKCQRLLLGLAVEVEGTADRIDRNLSMTASERKRRVYSTASAAQ